MIPCDSVCNRSRPLAKSCRFDRRFCGPWSVETLGTNRCWRKFREAIAFESTCRRPRREVSVEALIDGQSHTSATRREFADRDIARRQTQSHRRFAGLDCRHHAIRLCRDRADVKAARRSGQRVLANRYPAGRSRCLGFADSWSIDDLEV